jgi:hypothetical protein
MEAVRRLQHLGSLVRTVGLFEEIDAKFLGKFFQTNVDVEQLGDRYNCSTATAIDDAVPKLSVFDFDFLHLERGPAALRTDRSLELICFHCAGFDGLA